MLTNKQKDAINTIDSNVAISAGAGSGKTSVLVQRFLEIIRTKKAECREILAITFTNKAATEMKERIINNILQYSFDPTSTKEARDFWQTELNNAAYANISTLHSLYANILRENPVEAKLDPSFQVVQEAEELFLLEQFTENFLLEKINTANLQNQNLYLEYGKTEFSKLLKHCAKNLTNLISEQTFIAELMKPYEQLLLNNECKLSPLQLSLKNNLSEIINNLENLKSGKVVLEQRKNVLVLQNDQANIFQAIDELQLNYISEKIAPLQARASDKEWVKAARANLEQLWQILIDRKAHDLLHENANLLYDYCQKWRDFKFAKNILSFDDTEFYAVKLLTNNARICQKYMTKFKYIMVDEFQDINEEQQKLIYLLSGASLDKLYRKNLFIVGDEKQSIYRFRGSNVHIFNKVKKDILASGGKLIELDDNFRSQSKIIDFSNSLFTDLMTGSTNNSIDFIPLVANKFVPDDCVKLLLTAGVKNIQQEIENIARQIKFMLNVHSDLSYKDIAILLKKRKNVDLYLKTFATLDIPIVAQDTSGFYEQQEIKDILNILTFLANKYQTISLLGILRSPFFAVSDETITRLKINDGENLWEYLISKEWQTKIFDLSEQQRLSAAIDTLQALSALALENSLAELLKIIYDKLAIYPYLLAQNNGKQKSANVQKFFDQTLEFTDKNTDSSLTDFLSYINILCNLNDRESIAQVSSELDDCVKILTIHKSKGLEFKFVIIPELEDDRTANNNSFNFNRQLGLGIRVKYDVSGSKNLLQASSVYHAISDVDTTEELEERKRLFYVAATRAEEYLLLSAKYNDAKKDKTEDYKNWLGWIANTFTEKTVDSWIHKNDASCRIELINSDDLQTPLPILLAESEYKNSILDQEAEQELEKRLAPLPDFTQQNITRFSATSLKDYLHCARKFYYKYLVQIPERESDFIAGTTGKLPGYMLGLVIHGVLEKIKILSLEQALDEAVVTFVPKEMRKVARVQAQDLLEKFLQSPIYAEHKDIPSDQEVGFLLPLFTEANETFWFAGIFDCILFYQDGSVGIIDYKTNRNDDVYTIEDYKIQLAIYVLAAEKLFQTKVSSAELIFLKTSKKYSLDLITEINALTTKVLSLVKEIREKTTEHDFAITTKHCKYCLHNYMCPKK